MYTSVKINIARRIYKYVHFCIKTLCDINTYVFLLVILAPYLTPIQCVSSTPFGMSYHL